jgi:hypothetical protein
MLEKRDRKKGYLLQGADPGRIHPEMMHKISVYGIIKRLKTKGFERNISKAAGVTVV